MRVYSLYIYKGERRLDPSRIKAISLERAKEQAFGVFRALGPATHMKLLDDDGNQVWEWREPDA